MTIGKAIIKISITVEGDNNDVETFMNNLNNATYLDGWYSNNSLFTKEIDYNSPMQDEIDLFNTHIENNFINNTSVYTDVKRFYQWQ